MPVVKTCQTYFGPQPCLLKINCNSQGKFTARIPDFAHNALGYDIVNGSTLEECEKRWKKAGDDYQQSNTVTTKVICYEIEATATIERDGKVAHQFDDDSFPTGIMLSVWANVYEESCTTKPDGKQTFDYKELDSKLPWSLTKSHSSKTGYHQKFNSQIPWTQEREDFFCRIAFAMESVIIELKKLHKPEHALAIADTGRLLGFGGGATESAESASTATVK